MSQSDIDALVEAAKIIADKAKDISSTFSVRIPAATHVTVNQGLVAVVTDGAAAPNAAPFEAGELHPLWAKVGSWRYDHGRWGKQPLRPYMMEAATAELGAAANAFADSVYVYAIKLGFK